MKFLSKKCLFTILFISGCVLMFFTSAHAQFTSTNFQLENPVNTIEGGQSSSANFQYFSSTGELDSGQSTSSNFAQNAGFLYFPTATSPIVSATAGDGQVALSWTSATGILANITSYELGMSTTSGGTYTFISVGSVLNTTKTSLTNGTPYFFKVRSYAYGVLLSESAVVTATPVLPSYITSSITIGSIIPTQPISESLASSDGTNANVNISANTLPNTDTYKISMYSFPQADVSTTLPVPSGKVAATTMYNFTVYSESNLTAVSNFTEPVTVRVSYTNADVSNLVPSSLALYSWDGSQWTVLNNQVLDTTNNTISGTTLHFSNFAILGTPISSIIVTPPSNGNNSGGGGGNGNSSTAPSTPTVLTSPSVIFSGRAYPYSKVILLKDAQILVSTVSGGDASFSINVNNLTAGSYIFSVYSEDYQGNRSPMLTFPISITAGASTDIGGIFIAPTISVDKSEVKKGDNITFFGQSIPNSQINIAIHSANPIFKQTTSDKNGVYLQMVDSSQLQEGSHLAISNVASGAQISSDSNAVSFSVGDKNITAQTAKNILKGDLNKDGKVNGVDFSILAYWYKKKNPPANVLLDGAKEVDYADFSIMAYYWTG